MSYRIVVGLEVHVQLLTKTKLYCGCPTKFGARPNSQTCPVCLGMPGSLPVMNRHAFRLALRMATAMGGEIAEFTKWDRKNYYYPDLPKNYQISQYDLPFCNGGSLDIETEAGPKRVRLIRIHLEEDAGKNLHDDAGGDSLVDLNRAGTPLLEIVSEPDMGSPAEAAAYLTKLRQLARDLEISDCEMQEGSLRCDANVNIHVPLEGRTAKTPVVEIKNMNSIKMIEKAIAYEADRQFEQWRKDGREFGSAPKQTRGWDDSAGVTRLQREKEDVADYRYFPEPDLVPVVVDAALLADAAGGGERADDRRARYETALGVTPYAANVIVEQGKATIDYFERLLELGVEAKSAANWIINDILAHSIGRLKAMSDIPVSPESLAELIWMVADRKLNLNDAREKVLPVMRAEGRSAAAIAKELGLEVVTDTSAIEAVVAEAMAEMPQAVADVRAGKQKAMGSLVGLVMKKSKGKFPPAAVNEILAKKLAEG
jgi:aspartyl-tRNA(Asn)/glutamyl-tRNA(Gln) amidotransferase subunit B